MAREFKPGNFIVADAKHGLTGFITTSGMMIVCGTISTTFDEAAKAIKWEWRISGANVVVIEVDVV